MTNQQIIDAIRARGYPDDLTDAMIVESINGVLRDVKYDYPIETFGTFTTVVDQQLYDLFSATVNTTIQQGVLPGGLRVLEIIGGPLTGDSSLDVFGMAPWLQAYGDAAGAGTVNLFSFTNPGDFTLWEENWSSWIRRFGTYNFMPVDSLPGSAIRVMPKPTEVKTLLVRYTKARTSTDLQSQDESWFLWYVEAQCCRTLANLFSVVAGVKIAENADQGKTHAHFVEMANLLDAKANSLFEKHRFENLGLGIRS